MDEARAIDLLRQPLAWPLAKRLARKQRRTARCFGLYDYLYRKDRFFVMQAHDFQPDRISAWVVDRHAFTETYARPIREKRDSELDDKTLDAIQHDVMPQFTLRNIGRYEMAVDIEAGLPWQHQDGIGGEIDNPELAQARHARLPEIEPVQIWSADYMARMRAQLRRLVLEDPWALKYGPEATSVHSGPGRTYVAEGTHPDDLPGADFSPRLIPRPAEWVETPKGEHHVERPYDIVSDARRIDGGKSSDDFSKFEL